MMPYVITAVVSILVAAVVVWFISDVYHKKAANSKIGNAEARAREIIDEAVKTAETKKREALLEAKEENLKAQNELEKEIKDFCNARLAEYKWVRLIEFVKEMPKTISGKIRKTELRATT